MGAWGHQPKDNDGAWDIADLALARAEAWLANEYPRLASARLAVKPKRRRASKHAETDAWARADVRFVRAGAVQIILERGVSVRRALVEQAAADLDSVLADDVYVERWRAPRAFRVATARILGAMRALLKQGVWRKGRCFSTRRPGKGWSFHPSPHLLAPFGWPAKNAGRRSWTGIELHHLGRVRVGGRRRRHPRGRK